MYITIFFLSFFQEEGEDEIEYVADEDFEESDLSDFEVRNVTRKMITVMVSIYIIHSGNQRV